MGSTTFLVDMGGGPSFKNVGKRRESLLSSLHPSFVRAAVYSKHLLCVGTVGLNHAEDRPGPARNEHPVGSRWLQCAVRAAPGC